jgi:hypothetical protein
MKRQMIEYANLIIFSTHTTKTVIKTNFKLCRFTFKRENGFQWHENSSLQFEKNILMIRKKKESIEKLNHWDQK